MASHGSFFHDARWLAVLAECFRYRVRWISAFVDDALVGCLPVAEVPGSLFGPRRLVSLPFSYAAGPMASSSDVAESLCTAAVDLARGEGIRRVEVKGLDGHPIAPAFERSLHYATYRIPTEGGEEHVFRKLFTDGTRGDIRKSIKRGIRAVRGTSAAEWLAMAKLSETNFHAHGVPPAPRRFFTEGCRSMQEHGIADLYVARNAEDRTVAGMVVWKGPREWIDAFSALEPGTRADRPNHVILWAAVRDAMEAGVTFDLGRAAPEQKGLVDFKRHWGGVPVQLAYDYWPKASGLNVGRRDTGKLALASRLWSRLPAAIAERGSVLYRYLG